MIRRDQIEPGVWFAVPVLGNTPGPIRADLAYILVTANNGFRVEYTEHRRGLDQRCQAQRFECSPETFQARVNAEGCAIVASQVPEELLA